MAQVVIDPDANLTTLINVFHVVPERQEELVRMLTRATEETMQYMPGFISATIHGSDDGTRVTNYAQWTSHETYAAMLSDPAAQTHMRPAAELAESFDPKLYRSRSVHVRTD